MTEATAAALVARLRAGLAVDAVDPAAQARYERWAGREQWRARSEALPLLVGVEPAEWGGSERARSADAAALWSRFAAELGLDANGDLPLSPARVREWARGAGVALPRALARLLDFIASVLPATASGGTPQVSEVEVLRAQERETVLGAALMLVTREAHECVDEEGYLDPGRIARLVRARSLLWFPLAPPQLSEADITRLLARWLPDPRRA